MNPPCAVLHAGRLRLTLVILAVTAKASFLSLSTAGCSHRAESERAPSYQYSVEEVATFLVDPVASIGSLGRHKVNLPPALPVGRIVALHQSSDGSLFALDRDYKRVLVLTADGELIRTVGNGYGTRSGELVLPRDLTVDRSGRLHVADYTLEKVSVFDSAGSLHREFPIAGSFPFAIETHHGQVSILAPRSAKGPALAVYDSLGTLLRNRVHLGSREASYSLGSPGALARTRSGDLLVAYSTPGIWTLLANGERGVRLGAETFPRLRPTIRRTSRTVRLESVPAGTVGVGQVQRDRVIIYYFAMGEHVGKQAGQVVFAIDVFTFAGDYLGTCLFDSVAKGSYLGRAFAASSRDDFSFFQVERDPQRIVQYELIETPLSDRDKDDDSPHEGRWCRETAGPHGD